MFSKKQSRVAVQAACLAVCLVARAGWADSFSSSGNLVVMRATNGTGAEKIFLDEYNVSGATPVLVQSIALPFTGSDAITTPGLMNHDRHLHRSADGRYLTFAGYNAAYGPTDPSTTPSASTPRVAAVVGADGNFDLSTKLTDAYDGTTIRGVTSSDGTKLWVTGDNKSGTTSTGGTRFTNLGSSTTVNLSKVQVPPPSSTLDNVRDISIFAGQLYESSGSGSSVGKAVLQVGVGLPESGSQSLTTLTTDGQSTNCFYFVDADAGITGLDTLYTATGSGVRKYNLVGGVWTAMGLFTSTSEIEQVAVALDSLGVATIYAGGPGALFKITDSTPYGGLASGSLPTLLTPAEGFTFGGLDFAPVPEPGTLCLLAAGFAGLLIRRRVVR